MIWNKIIIIPLLILLMVSTTLAQDSPDEPHESAGIDSVRNNKAVIYPGFGVGLVRNELTPVFHINIGFNRKNRYEGNINTSSYFFFEKNTDSKYSIHRNTFLSAEFLLNFSPLSRSIKNWNGVGVGYLIEARGRYFSEPAMIIYYKRKYRFFSVMPGIVFDDNFKDVWPVISIRL